MSSPFTRSVRAITESSLLKLEFDLGVSATLRVLSPQEKHVVSLATELRSELDKLNAAEQAQVAVLEAS